MLSQSSGNWIAQYGSTLISVHARKKRIVRLPNTKPKMP
jgi:hypothetical protein